MTVKAQRTKKVLNNLSVDNLFFNQNLIDQQLLLKQKWWEAVGVGGM